LKGQPDNSIPATILNKDEWLGKMKVWNEATTTSPSAGLHLGHRKCLIQEIESQKKGGGLSDEAIEALEELEVHREKMLEAQITLINHAITQPEACL
jgi:hypothetical protein